MVCGIFFVAVLSFSEERKIVQNQNHRLEWNIVEKTVGRILKHTKQMQTCSKFLFCYV